MAYCPRCGVEVEDRLDACPLCGTTIPEEVRASEAAVSEYPADVIPPRSMYRPLTGAQRRGLFRGAVGFLALFPVALTSFLDLTRNGVITWSYFVIVPVVATAFIAWLFYRFGRNPLISVTGSFLTVIAVYLLILLRISASVSPMLPIFIVAFLAAESFLLFLVVRRRPVPGIITFAAVDISFLVVALEMLLRSTENFSSFSIASGEGGWWSGIVAAVLIPIAAYSTYLRRVRRKGLNLGGFFFLDLTVMLWAVDLMTGGGMGWSWITALIFVPVAVIFYVLHVSLFNDTDWKKALHL